MMTMMEQEAELISAEETEQEDTMSEGFVTKDSGARQTFETGMVRDTARAKARYDLLYLPMLKRWAELMGRGAEKYGERNWEKARTEAEYSRFRESAFRHFMQWFTGESPEEDHAAAIMFNVSGAEYVKGRLDNVKAPTDTGKLAF
jgi:hypothetical protein